MKNEIMMWIAENLGYLVTCISIICMWLIFSIYQKSIYREGLYKLGTYDNRPARRSNIDGTIEVWTSAMMAPNMEATAYWAEITEPDLKKWKNAD